MCGACLQDLVQLATYSTWIPRRQRSVRGLGVDSVRGLLQQLVGQQAPKLSARMKALAISALLQGAARSSSAAPQHIHVPAIRVGASAGGDSVRVSECSASRSAQYCR
jgi:hypothetical protein